ncbi:hypothetical protein N1851_011269 [Merluccius polli]|uniref:Uncharacterized protein n=1 Tax=Merluccius polli TaxID=89951 RepID=A0AA47MXL9_MERPO|nr:hypothetical protein N1851_011269 [Merluccius polli]
MMSSRKASDVRACPICGKLISHLSQHLTGVHKVSNVQEKNLLLSWSSKLNCGVCDKVGLSRLDKHLADLHQLRPDRDPPCDEDLNSGTPHTPASQRDSSCDEDMALELEESDSEEPEVGRPLKRRVVKRKLSFSGPVVEKSGVITGQTDNS